MGTGGAQLTSWTVESSYSLKDFSSELIWYNENELLLESLQKPNKTK